MATGNIPVVSSAEGGLSNYLNEIRRFPMLEPRQEYMLAKSYLEHDDRDAAHQLVTSHLRLVAKIAMGYRGYGLPIGEVVSEGNVGLMQAVKRFDPEKGFRLATYAMWWIKASIQEYILRSWSLVKMGTTANQKRLFFNLRKVKSHMSSSRRTWTTTVSSTSPRRIIFRTTYRCFVAWVMAASKIRNSTPWDVAHCPASPPTWTATVSSIS